MTRIRGGAARLPIPQPPPSALNVSRRQGDRPAGDARCKFRLPHLDLARHAARLAPARNCDILALAQPLAAGWAPTEGNLSMRQKRDLTTWAMWAIGGILVAAIGYGSLKTLQAGSLGAAAWRDLVVFGLAQGSLYALIALGYTLVYGILRMINFAHGEVFMAGAFSGYYLAHPLFSSPRFNQDAAALPWVGGLVAALGAAHPLVVTAKLLLVLALAVAVSVTVAVLLERIAYRPLRRAPRLVPLITAIGASIFLQYSFAGLFGSNPQTYPDIPLLSGKTRVLGLEILRAQLLVIVAAACLMALLVYLVQYTRTGQAMRAVSEDKDTAALMGIDVDAVIVRTFVVGGALAGSAGLLYALLNKQVHFFMGFQPGLKAFTAAVLGGIGNVPGAMLGGLFLGLFESVGPSLFLDGLRIPAAYQLKDAIAFTMLVLVLIFRPTGILGERLGGKRA